MDEPNVYILIGRAENNNWLSPLEVKRIIAHYQTLLNAKNETLSRIRDTLNSFAL